MSGHKVNNFVLKMANVNGTGSASANGLVSKAIFRMGVPMSAKNFFPSNIQGLPTWYEIRISGDGYRARAGQVDVMVAMNAQTYKRDVAEVCSGGYLIYDSTWPWDEQLTRDDITFIGVPFARMASEAFTGSRIRILMKNVIYAGALAALLDIDMAVIKQLLKDQFGDKQHLIDANHKAIALGYDFAKENFDCPLQCRLESDSKTDGQIVIDGNAAAALGCLYAGATVGAWYPITPSTSLMDAFAGYCNKFRSGEEGNRFMIIQAEDELAAIGMVVGASWNGARAFTPTSGPGISLMSEFIGFAYYTEIPAVLFDIQRVGPSTGMPTRTQQCDILICAYASHGDTQHVCLYPANPEECFEMAADAFDLAERLQTPVFVVSDLDIGMNEWACPEFTWDDARRPDRGEVLDAEQLAAIEKFHRYLDDDNDGIAARSLPGVHPKGAYFTRGSGHNKFGGYTEDADEYQEVLDRLKFKFNEARHRVPAAVESGAHDGEVGIIAYGSSDGAMIEALDRLKEQGLDAAYLRIRGFPFGSEVQKFIDRHEVVFIVEQNRDAQMRTLLMNDLGVRRDDLVPLLHYSGLPIYADFIVQGVLNHLQQRKTA